MEYRLNRYISSSGYCSRREADKLIEEGHVTIDGKRASIGMRVLPGQKVKVHGELIENGEEPVYIAFNKPVGVVCTTDTQEKDNIIDYIAHEQRIFPIGRLDKDSQGLILLTNDGDIVNKILRVGNNHKKEYIVSVNKPITKTFLTKMSQGVPILDRVTRRCEITEINPHTFRIVLTQGLNRQIRRMCEYFDYEVVKLERIRIMNIKLGSLGQGNWRNLTTDELEGLFTLLEKSKDVAQTPKPANKASQGRNVKNNRRNMGSAVKQNNKPIQAKSSKPFTEAATNSKPKKKKNGLPQTGKPKATNKKMQTKQFSQSKRRKA